MTNSGDNRVQNNDQNQFLPDDAIDIRELFIRLLRGLPQIIGFALVGLALAGAGYMAYSPFQNVTTTTRVAFAFPGFEKGLYPDGSKFQPDDLRAADIVVEALKRRNLDTSPEFQSKVRAAISIEGIVPPNIIKDRDRIRATGQTPPVFIPDEYTITLTLPRKFPLDNTQRSQLLNEVIALYRDNFRRVYADTPIALGNAFKVLQNADYPDYEAVFEKEIRSITTYLTEQSENAKLFRSTTTTLSFSDLLKQVQLFSQIYLYEVIGLIHENGLSHNRKIALTRMNDALRLLNNEERRAVNAESVIKDLLKQAQDRDQKYIIGVKDQAAQPRSNSPVLDQSVIDSLLANDSYAFLIKKALEAGLKVKQIQDDKTWQIEQIENMKAFANESATDQSAVIAQIKVSMAKLEVAYNELIEDIRKTHKDYSLQTYGDAIRLSAGILNTSLIRPILVPALIGAFLGAAFGAGLALLGIHLHRKHESHPAPEA